MCIHVCVLIVQIHVLDNGKKTWIKLDGSVSNWSFNGCFSSECDLV